MSLVTLAKVKARLGFTDTRNDAELLDLIAAATPVVEEMTGPVVQATVVEVLSGFGPTFVLRSSQVASVMSVTTVGGVLTTAFTLSPGGLLTGSGLSGATVVYVAGRATIPANIERAALRYVVWSWRRDHGGSESYLPAGDDAAPGLGPAGIERELRLILGPDVRGMRVA